MSPKARMAKLDEAYFEDLTTPSATAYRRAYQRHRLGFAKGASGEAPAVEADVGEGAESMRLDEGPANGAGGVHGKGEMYANELGFHALLAWRLSYQAHRCGKAKGAKGEIGAGLTIAEVRMLPVARQAEHYHSLRRAAKRQARADRAAAKPPLTEKPLHIHVGAGRLGLGLIVPALAAGAKVNEGRLVLLQRPSDAWKALADGAVARFTVNSELVCRLRVVRGMPASGSLSLLLSEGESDGLLVLSEEAALLDELARRATSLSCSLGPALVGGMAPLLAALARRVHSAGSLKLYAGENDHDAVDKFALTEAVTAAGLKVLPLLVDRVCTDRTISEDGVDTAAEPWGGEIVVMTSAAESEGSSPNSSAHAGESFSSAPASQRMASFIESSFPTKAEYNSWAGQQRSPSADAGLVANDRSWLMALPPFAGASVRWPSSAAEAHFLHRRKILTVNGTHTTLAFLALAFHEPPPHTGLPLGSHPLPRALPSAADSALDISDAAADEALQVEENERMVWAWVVARQLLLLFESSTEVACAALGCQRATEEESHAALADALLSGARVSVERLGTGGDTTARVLGGGVVNRYNTRLKPIASFLEGQTGSKYVGGKLPRLLLRRAKLTETAMRLAVLGLARDAERFAVDTKIAAPAKGGPGSPKPTPKPSPKPSPKKQPAGGPSGSPAGARVGAAGAASAEGGSRLSVFAPSQVLTSLLGGIAYLGGTGTDRSK